MTPPIPDSEKLSKFILAMYKKDESVGWIVVLILFLYMLPFILLIIGSLFFSD